MAQNKETRIWHELKDLNKDWHFTRIESSTVNGIPDVHCVVNKQVFWLELKANTSKNCGLSKYQINWHIKYLKAGGRAYILNRPLLQAPYELLAVNRESRTPLPLSRHTDLKTLITFASQLAAGPVKLQSWSHAHAPVSHPHATSELLNSGRRSWSLGSGAAGQEMVWFLQGVGMVYFHFPFSTHAPVPIPKLSCFSELSLRSWAPVCSWQQRTELGKFMCEK